MQRSCHILTNSVTGSDLGGQAGEERAPPAPWGTSSSLSLFSAAFGWWAHTFSPTHPSWHESSGEQNEEGATHVQDPEDGRNDSRCTLMAKRLSKVCPLQGNLLQKGWQKLSLLPKFKKETSKGREEEELGTGAARWSPNQWQIPCGNSFNSSSQTGASNSTKLLQINPEQKIVVVVLCTVN